MLIISYMSRLNSCQVTLPQHQTHYLQLWCWIPRRIGMLKYENWVYCPADNQYAPKKLQRDCVWLSHLKGFAYICDSLWNRLLALWNTSIWKCGELKSGRVNSGGVRRSQAPPTWRRGLRSCGVIVLIGQRGQWRQAAQTDTFGGVFTLWHWDQFHLLAGKRGVSFQNWEFCHGRHH